MDDDQDDQRIYQNAKKFDKYPAIRKVGSFKMSEQKNIAQIVFKVEAHYPNDIKNQCDLIGKMIQQQFGKHFQLFVFDRLADQGHHLVSINGRHILLQYKDYMYIIWQVLLDESNK